VTTAFCLLSATASLTCSEFSNSATACSLPPPPPSLQKPLLPDLEQKRHNSTVPVVVRLHYYVYYGEWRTGESEESNSVLLLPIVELISERGVAGVFALAMLSISLSALVPYSPSTNIIPLHQTTHPSSHLHRYSVSSLLSSCSKADVRRCRSSSVENESRMIYPPMCGRNDRTLTL
jgi:hypothetical protein